MKKSKLEMAIYIADTLFANYIHGGAAKENNWKVKSLMKKSKRVLEHDCILAERCRGNYLNRTILNSMV